MTTNEVGGILDASWRDKIILNNKYKWEFLDEYTFTDFKKDNNCPTFTSRALGNALYDDEWCEAMLTVTKSKSAPTSVALYLHSSKYDKKCYWNSMISIVSAERI